MGLAVHKHGLERRQARCARKNPGNCDIGVPGAAWGYAVGARPRSMPDQWSCPRAPRGSCCSWKPLFFLLWPGAVATATARPTSPASEMTPLGRCPTLRACLLTTAWSRPSLLFGPTTPPRDREVCFSPPLLPHSNCPQPREPREPGGLCPSHKSPGHWCQRGPMAVSWSTHCSDTKALGVTQLTCVPLPCP